MMDVSWPAFWYTKPHALGLVITSVFILCHPIRPKSGSKLQCSSTFSLVYSNAENHCVVLRLTLHFSVDLLESTFLQDCHPSHNFRLILKVDRIEMICITGACKARLSSIKCLIAGYYLPGSISRCSGAGRLPETAQISVRPCSPTPPTLPIHRSLIPISESPYPT